jgi:hypothetical protein
MRYTALLCTVYDTSPLLTGAIMEATRLAEAAARSAALVAEAVAAVVALGGSAEDALDAARDAQLEAAELAALGGLSPGFEDDEDSWYGDEDEDVDAHDEKGVRVEHDFSGLLDVPDGEGTRHALNLYFDSSLYTIVDSYN